MDAVHTVCDTGRLFDLLLHTELYMTSDTYVTPMREPSDTTINKKKEMRIIKRKETVKEMSDLSSTSRGPAALRPTFAREPSWLATLYIALTLIQTATAGFIDMDTPLDKRATQSLVDGSTYHLVSYRFIRKSR